MKPTLFSDPRSLGEGPGNGTSDNFHELEIGAKGQPSMPTYDLA